MHSRSHCLGCCQISMARRHPTHRAPTRSVQGRLKLYSIVSNFEQSRLQHCERLNCFGSPRGDNDGRCLYSARSGAAYLYHMSRSSVPPPLPPIPTGNTEWRITGPRIRESADIHMTPAAVESMQDNEQLFADIMRDVTSKPATLFFALGHATYAFGLAHAKNPDGSLDIHVDSLGATAGGHPILLPPDTCMAVIQGV
jgi:hypothetical protein